MNLFLLGVSGVSLLELKWGSLDWVIILESLRMATLGRPNWILGLKTASCDVRCSWQWFPKPWKSTCETVVCFSFPGKKQKQKQNKNQNFVIYSDSICNQTLFFLVLLQYCTPQPHMPLHSNSVLHQRAQPMHMNFQCAFGFAVKKHGERKSLIFSGLCH